MVYFSPCKVNIGLKILNKRDDGFHNLETIFYNIPFYDIIEILPSKTFEFVQTGLVIPDNGKENLCVSAYNLLKASFPFIPNIYLHLHKIIPAGAGLGGGSANAATILTALNNQFNCKCTQTKLLQMALTLGSDCPFFVLNKLCIGQSRGEVLTPVALSLSGYYMHVINPGIHISTKAAFANLALPTNPFIPYQDAYSKPIEEWKSVFENDFEQSIFPHYTEIENIKNALYAQDAIYASMSGTGSTVYGIFKEETALSNWPSHYLQKQFKLEW